MAQLHNRECFKPIHKKDLTNIEKKWVLELLIFLTEKKSGELKARHCINSIPQHQYMNHEEVSSPMVSTEWTILTLVIEAYKNCNIGTGNIPNAFIQMNHLITDKDGHKMIMRMQRKVVEILCQIDPTYKDYMIEEQGQPTLYVHIMKIIYGLLVSAMLFYEKLATNL